MAHSCQLYGSAVHCPHKLRIPISGPPPHRRAFAWRVCLCRSQPTPPPQPSSHLPPRTAFTAGTTDWALARRRRQPPARDGLSSKAQQWYYHPCHRHPNPLLPSPHHLRSPLPLRIPRVTSALLPSPLPAHPPVPRPPPSSPFPPPPARHHWRHSPRGYEAGDAPLRGLQ